MDIKSKITWINVLSIIILVLGAVQEQFPEWAKYTALAVAIITIILRQLQGREINIGGKKIKV